MQPLYQVQNPINSAMQGMSQAANTYAAMDKKKYRPEPTIGGGIMTGAGGALAGAELGKLISASAAAGPWGAGIGAALGMLSYFLS